MNKARAVDITLSQTRIITIAALMVAAAVLTPHLAYAQATTGGNAGLLATAITWVTQNFIGGLIQIGVLAGGVILMFMRMHLTGLATMVVGSLVATNYEALATLL